MTNSLYCIIRNRCNIVTEMIEDEMSNNLINSRCYNALQTSSYSCTDIIIRSRLYQDRKPSMFFFSSFSFINICWVYSWSGVIWVSWHHAWHVVKSICWSTLHITSLKCSPFLYMSCALPIPRYISKGEQEILL